MANPRIDELRRRLDKEPGSRLFAQLAEELRKDGELEEAIQVCREGLRAHANYPSAHMTLGRALFDTGDLKAAKREFEAVLKGAPDNILASRLLGESLEGLGELQAAAERFKKTLAMAPGDKQVASKLEAVTRALKTTAAPAPAASPSPLPPVAPGAEPAPIKVVQVDEPMELERPHEAPAVSFSASPPPPTAARPAPAAPATTQPLPVVKEQEFELERPYDVPTVSVRPSEPAAPVADELPAPTLPIGGGDAAFAEAPATARPPAFPTPEPELEPPPRAWEPQPAAPPAFPMPEPEPPPRAAEPQPEAQPEPVVEPEVERAEIEIPEMAMPVAAPPPSPEPLAPEPPPPPMPEPPAPEPPAVEPPAAVAPSEEMASVTLAELYFNQGFADKAIDVLKRLLAREPENERARARLLELEAREAQLAAEQQRVAAVVGPGVDAKAVRRQAIARTIAELEKLLAAVRRG